jgi:hypothetical protein
MHLRRDFQGFVDRGGRGKPLGEKLLEGLNAYLSRSGMQTPIGLAVSSILSFLPATNRHVDSPRSAA